MAETRVDWDPLKEAWVRTEEEEGDKPMSMTVEHLYYEAVRAYDFNTGKVSKSDKDKLNLLFGKYLTLPASKLMYIPLSMKVLYMLEPDRYTETMFFDYVDRVKKLEDGVVCGEDPKAPGYTADTLKKLQKLKEDSKALYDPSYVLAFGPIKEEETEKESEPMTTDPKIKELETLVAKMGEKEKTLSTQLKRAKTTAAKLRAKVKVRSTLEEYSVPATEDGTMPEGKPVLRSIKEMFPDLGFTQDFEVITWDWKDGAKHPHVPEVDPHYVFRKEQVLQLLYSAATNSRAWLYGDYGTGKTTLIQQVAAVLKQPVMRINLDENLDTDELIGKTELTVNAEGVQVTQFKEGTLPTYMVQPYWIIGDEYDASNSNVGYALQAVIENKGVLRIMADGGREVKPHPMFRLFATGNTVGQGDEKGMYQGIRPQSLAVLDRFSVWIHMPQLTSDERGALLRNKVPHLSDEEYKIIEDYATEHLKAYEMSDIIQPISMRGLVAIAEATSILGDVKQAIQMVAVNKANQEDYAVLTGLVDKVCK